MVRGVCGRFGSLAHLVAVATIVSQLAPSGARADDRLDAAERMLDQADFAGAIDLFERAAASSDLTRAEVVALLDGRARAEHAARQTDAAELSIVALLSLEPDYQLDERAPPSLRRVAERLRATIVARLDVAVETTPADDGVDILTNVTNDPASLVRTTRIHVRQVADDANGGQWRVEEGRRAHVDASAGVSYYVEAIGPGGAVVASAGSAQTPRVVRSGLAPGDGDDGHNNNGDGARGEGGHGGGGGDGVHEGGGDPWPWIGLGIGGALLAGAAVVLILALTGAFGGSTQPSAPMEIR